MCNKTNIELTLSQKYMSNCIFLLKILYTNNSTSLSTNPSIFIQNDQKNNNKMKCT